jgi:osmotically inducible lipoprotein OsmB
MTRMTVISLAALFGLALSGCGTRTSDRALSGGAIGAGAGAVGGAVVGHPLAGAAVGGAAGAATGAATSPNQVDLGRPAWR